MGFRFFIESICEQIQNLSDIDKKTALDKSDIIFSDIDRYFNEFFNIEYPPDTDCILYLRPQMTEMAFNAGGFMVNYIKGLKDIKKKYDLSEKQQGVNLYKDATLVTRTSGS